MPDLLFDIHFIRPQLLWLLVPVAVIAVFLRAKLVKQYDWSTLVDSHLLEHLLDNPDNRHQQRRNRRFQYFLLGSMALAIVALAGPAWEKSSQPVFQRNDTLVIIADLTLSMHTQDISPSRLIRMRYKLLELLKQRQEGETALIAYSGDAHVVSPVSDDSNTIAALVPALTPEIMPGIGSNPVAALRLAGELLDQTPTGNKRIAWFTDGISSEQQGPVKKEINSLVEKTGAQILVIGIGTSQGGPVPLPSGKFLKDNLTGQPVTAQFDAGPLIELTRDIDGIYLDLRADNRDIDIINAAGIAGAVSQDEKQTTQHRLEHRFEHRFETWQDRGAWFVPLLLPAILLGFRRGWLLTATCFIALGFSTNPLYADELSDGSSNAGSSFWKNLWQRKDQQAYSEFSMGNYSEAAELFESGEWRGAAHFRQNEYELADQAFGNAIAGYEERLLENQDSRYKKQLANSYYNKGHALARGGELEAALSAYDSALQYDEDFTQARQAREIVENLLQQQQQQQQQQEQNGNDQENREDGSQGGTQEPGEKQDKPGSTEKEASLGAQGQEQQQDQQSGEQPDSASSESAGSQNDRVEQNAAEQPFDQSRLQDNNPANDDGDNQSGNAADGNEATDELRGNDHAMAPDENPGSEQQNARLEQWLKQVENDPAGLLRRKFRYERELREREGTVINEQENSQLW